MNLLYLLSGLVYGATTVQALVQLPLKGYSGEVHPIPRYNRLKRDSTTQLQLRNFVSFYQVELSLGTPGQNTVYTIDTGSSDLWISSSDNPYCTTNAQAIVEGTGMNCSGEYSFDYQSSSTLQVNNTGRTDDFFIQYGDGTVAIGTWVTDVVQIGGNTLNNASFAVATRANSSQSVFGIGLQATEATFNNGLTGENYVYDNIPILLKNQGYIKTVAYSLWLNDIQSLEGSILFGGVDHSKYQGTLGLVPVVKGDPREVGVNSNDPVRLSVMLHGLALADASGNQQTIVQSSMPVLLDSGSTIIYLPSAMIDAIGRSIGGQYYSQAGGYVYYCDTPGSLVFDFSGVQISANLSSLNIDVSDTSTGGQATDNTGKAICMLGILPAGSTMPILGDLFLRSAYVVYDLDHLQIALANSNFNSSDSNVEEISNSIPSATSAASYSSTQSQSSFATTILRNFASSPASSGFGGVTFQDPSSEPTGNPLNTGTLSGSGILSTITNGSPQSGSQTTSRSSSRNAGHLVQPLSGLFGIISSFFILL